MREDPYEAFAERYDLFFGEFGERADAEVQFWKGILGRAEGVRVLDCACGTGRDIYMLHRLGYRVCGSDASRAMLSQAGRNLTACGMRVPMLQADFRQLPFSDAQFDAVLCLTTSLPHLLDEAEVVVALRSMWRVLRADGVLVLSQGFTDKLLRERPRFIPEINTVELSRILALDYLEGRVRVNVLDVVHGSERQEFEVYSFEYLLLLPDDYRRLLYQVGFTDVATYAGYADVPYDPGTSDKLVVLARK